MADNEKRSFFSSRFGRVGVIVVAVALAALVLMFAGAGTLNVGVTSSSGTLDGMMVEVALYKDDVTAALSDEDPSNDPEPLEVNRAEVGQRTSFSVKELGAHTIQATLVDPVDGFKSDSTPVVVNMFGIDSFSDLTMG